MKLLRRLLLFLGILIGVVLITAVVIAAFFEKQIGERLTTEINKQLRTELRIDEFEFSLLDRFPKAAGTLRNVRLEDTRGEELLAAGNVSFLFRPFSLFSDAIKVDEVVIENGILQIHTDARGNVNYDVTQTNEATDGEAGDGLGIALQRARLDDVLVRYTNEQNEQNHEVLIETAEVSGDLGSTRFVVDADAQMVSRQLALSGTRYLVDKPLRLNATMSVDTETGIISTEHTQLTVAENTFGVEGTMKNAAESTDFNLEFYGEETGLAELLSVLPNSYLSYLNGVKANGNFSMDGFVRGTLSERQVPTFKVDVYLDEGSLRGGPLPSRFEGVGFKLTVENGVGADMRSAVVELREFVAATRGEIVRGQLLLRNFEDPTVDLRLDGAVPLALLAPLLTDGGVTEAEGNLVAQRLRVNGLLRNLTDPARMTRVSATGALTTQDVELEFHDDERLEISDGTLEINGNSLNLNNLRIEGADSDFTIGGVFYNVIPVLLADSLNTKRAFLQFDAQLLAEELDLDELMRTFYPSAPTTELVTKGEAAAPDNFTAPFGMLDGRFETELAAFNYNEIEGENFRGTVEFRNREMTISGATDAMDGNFEVDGKMTFVIRPVLTATLDAAGVDIKEFFRQAENFGQNFLEDRHLEGNADAKMYVRAEWDAAGNFLDDQLYVIAGLDIADGYLRDFEMLEAFSTFINEKDLADIRFTRLQNWIRVRNGEIELPAMFIQSNAANLTVSGVHRFDYTYDYFFKVNAGQVVANRMKRHDPSLKPQRARRRGFFNLFYKVSGDLDDFAYETAKREVKSQFARSEETRDAIRQELETHFPQGTAQYDNVEALEVLE